ncbi:hypothetical protein MHK_004005 [Candidatus Magnetomorum sp. HK-1]|nr:hypothetical protein MHK_004005 [Candidatus Magnetomorum sp. HK-1]
MEIFDNNNAIDDATQVMLTEFIDIEHEKLIHFL